MFIHFDRMHEHDRRTDRHRMTTLATLKCIASHSKNSLVSSSLLSTLNDKKLAPACIDTEICDNFNHFHLKNGFCISYITLDVSKVSA